MTKPHIHLAQFLCNGPTYHSLGMWRHPRTAAGGYDWARPELYQHIARVCERGKFDMVFFADLNYISDTCPGVPSAPWTSWRALRPVLGKPEGPVLLDCKVNAEIAAPFMGEFAEFEARHQ